jgi:hypothetical protein
MKKFNEFVTENAWNQLGQKKPVGDILPAPAKGVVPKHGKKFKEGDSVIPHTGPHAGERHVVTSSRAGGVNMVYRGKSGNDKYNSITVRAKHEHLSPYIKSVAEAYVGQAVNSSDKKTIKVTGPDGRPYFKQIPAKRNLTQENTQLDEIQVNWSHSTQKYHTIKHPDGSHYGVFDHRTYGTKGHEIRKIKDSDGNVVKAKDSRKQGELYKSGMGSPSEAANAWVKKNGGTIINHKLKEKAMYNEYGMYMGEDDYEDEEGYQDEGEYDYEGDMAMSQLRTIIRNAESMLGMMERDTNLPEWVQSKLTLAEDYVMSSANYLMSRYEEDE